MQPARATYIWLSGKDSHHDIRGKDKTLYLTAEQAKLETAAELFQGHKDLFPVWNFDGSSTGQALGADTEILVTPVAVFDSPLESRLRWFIVLCECYTPNGQPTPDNHRRIARQVFEARPELKPWFGMEQEFVLMENNWPYGWPEDGFPAPQGPYYCGTGNVAYGRRIIDKHYELCLKMGLRVSGTNAEVLPGQWEFQVGPCEGIEAGDHMVVARWLLLRLLEKEGIQVDVSFSAKPIQGDWNGSGMHTNFSTVETRNPDNGMAAIKQCITNLSKTVAKDIPCYGSENNLRLTGKHETSKYSDFAFGVGTRTTSIRIPNAVQSQGYGYFEDRRPAGDADPYLVSARLFSSACGVPAPLLDEKSAQLRQSWMPAA